MRHYLASMLPADAISPLIGFSASIASATGIIVAQTSADVMPPVVKAWMEGGFSLALVVCLLYAVVTLWKRLNQRDADLAALNKEHREHQKAQSESLIETLEKLTDRIAERR
jgi:uncharacterized membrane protein (DUF106 family)